MQTTPSKGNADFAELFAKGKADITESKLRVVYSQPAPPPSPVPEGDEARSISHRSPYDCVGAVNADP